MLGKNKVRKSSFILSPTLLSNVDIMRHTVGVNSSVPKTFSSPIVITLGEFSNSSFKNSCVWVSHSSRRVGV